MNYTYHEDVMNLSFDHHCYEVEFKKHDGTDKKVTLTFIARNVLHLILCIGKNKPEGLTPNHISTIKELAYAPTVYLSQVGLDCKNSPIKMK